MAPGGARRCVGLPKSDGSPSNLRFLCALPRIGWRAASNFNMKLRRLGEFGLIDQIRRSNARDQGVRIGIGDDCAWVDQVAGSSLITADLLVEGIHFDLNWTS